MRFLFYMSSFADLTQYKGKQLEAVKRAVNSGVLNNTYRSHELVNLLSKIEADKGIIFDYANNAKIKESGFAVEGKNVTAYKSGNKVTLNIQSSKAWQSAVGHEITHVLEGTDAYDMLRESIYTYAASKGEYESKRAKIAALYKDMDADVDSEFTAELVGEYLFGDEEFVKHLTTNRNLFQRIYDEIKYLYKIATGKEQKEIAKAKRMFDKAWKELSSKPTQPEQKNNTAENSGVKYSIKNTSEISLKEQLSLFYNNKLKSSDALYFGTTPSILEKSGLSELPLALGQKDFKKSTNVKHNIPRRVLKNLNNSLSEPILSFAYENRVGVLTSDIDADGKPVLVAIEKSVMMDREPVNVIRSIYGLDNPKDWIKNQIEADKVFVFYNEKRANSFLQTYGYKASVEEGIKLLGESLTQDTDVVKAHSAESIDEQYLLAAESGDMATAQRFVDEAAEEAMKNSKIRDESGKLAKVYHGSESDDFFEFDKSRRGQTDTSMYGRGYYFAFDPDYASDFGDNIREFYLDVRNPFYIDVNAPSRVIAEFLESKGIEVNISDRNKQCHYFAKMFGSQKFTDTLVDLGYDGVIVRTDDGDYFETVAFHRNQMKLADAVTYDNNGNVIPISERFNEEKTDIRYSVSDKADDIAPVKSYGTPLNELYYDDIAPVRKDIAPAKIANSTNVAGKSKASAADDDIAPVRKDIEPARVTAESSNKITPQLDDIAPVKNVSNTQSGQNKNTVVSGVNQEGVVDVPTEETLSLKEQLLSSRELLDNMNVVASVNSDKIFNSKRDVIPWALEQFERIGYKINRENFGEVLLDKKRVNNGARYLKTNDDRISFAMVPDVIKSGVEIGRHPDHKNRNYDTITFAAPVEINGVRGNMAVIVRKQDKNYYKVHRVLMPNGSQMEFKEKGDTAERAGGAKYSSSLSPTDNVSTNSIPKDSESVKKNAIIAPIQTVEQRVAEEYF